MRGMISRYTMIMLVCIVLLSITGVFATWKYTLDDVNDVSTEISTDLNDFVYPLFTITYIVGEDVYLEEYHFDSSIDYTVIGSPNGFANFKQWVNANGVPVKTIPKTNTNNYTLYATWLNKYTINFIDSKGNLVYGEEFIEGGSKLSVEGQEIVDKWLENENRIENANDIYVTWSTYELAGATANIIVRPTYDYRGYLNMEPFYERK